VLAIFDKPDPLDGPFFEETIYVTPSFADASMQDAIVGGVANAAAAIGLSHGPVHAECRVNADGVFVLEVAARPIGGLCARALRFVPVGTRASGLALRIPAPASRIALEELLLRHALGKAAAWHREADASGVMMIPIPKRGVLRGVEGIDAARGVPGIVDLHITAKMEQLLVPLPEGASYLGFIFARADAPELSHLRPGFGDGGETNEVRHSRAVEGALREAHSHLRFAIDPELPLLNASQIHYNLLHG